MGTLLRGNTRPERLLAWEGCRDRQHPNGGLNPRGPVLYLVQTIVENLWADLDERNGPLKKLVDTIILSIDDNPWSVGPAA